MTAIDKFSYICLFSAFRFVYIALHTLLYVYTVLFSAFPTTPIASSRLYIMSYCFLNLSMITIGEASSTPTGSPGNRPIITTSLCLKSIGVERSYILMCSFVNSTG